ncbi:MAG: NAD-dependent epimerase/dehydratase family protein, partial [Pseudomonadota bacterium]
MAGSEGGHAPETVLVTGAAGFIGFHVASALLARGDRVVVADNLNPYYDVTLKEARVAELTARAAAGNGTLMFHRIDIADDGALSAIFADEKPARVIHLAAQAGVRHSLTDPQAYVSANIAGFVNLLEACRRTPVQHLTYASTSSVYGANRKLPFREGDGVDHPLQLYAATKRANELMAHAY